MTLPVWRGLLVYAVPRCRGRAAAKAYLMPNDVEQQPRSRRSLPRMSYGCRRKKLIPSGPRALKKERTKGRNAEVLPAAEEPFASRNLPAPRGVLARQPPCPPRQRSLPLSNEAGEGWMTAASQRAGDD